MTNKESLKKEIRLKYQEAERIHTHIDELGAELNDLSTEIQVLKDNLELLEE